MTAHIGLEIHIRLKTETKIFCNCPSSFGAEANTQVCPVCLGYPGTLPALNARVLEIACLVAQALHSRIPSALIFERKNYFYPDLSKNYQISQYALPIGSGGYFVTQGQKKIRIREVHLEEDAGKMIHAGDASYCDYNRAGTPLLEIVTEPDLESGEEVETLLQEFRRTVQYLDACDGNMEEGSLRCDVNISVSPSDALGTKVEIKNLNSFRFVRLATVHEITRQSQLLAQGQDVMQETRQWNEHRDRTEVMRSKENVHDYRYFPEPDLPPFPIHASLLKSTEAVLPELPKQRKERMIQEYGLSLHMAQIMTESKELADFFEHAVALGSDPKIVSAWLDGDVKKILNRKKVSLKESGLCPSRLHQLIMLIENATIQRRIAQRVLEIVITEDMDPLVIVERYKWQKITDEEELCKIAKQVIAAKPQAVTEFLEGKEKALDYLFGEMMKITEGRVDPKAGMSRLRVLLEVQKNE